MKLFKLDLFYFPRTSGNVGRLYYINGEFSMQLKVQSFTQITGKIPLLSKHIIRRKTNIVNFISETVICFVVLSP